MFSYLWTWSRAWLSTESHSRVPTILPQHPGILLITVPHQHRNRSAPTLRSDPVQWPRARGRAPRCCRALAYRLSDLTAVSHQQTNCLPTFPEAGHRRLLDHITGGHPWIGGKGFWAAESGWGGPVRIRSLPPPAIVVHEGAWPAAAYGRGGEDEEVNGCPRVIVGMRKLQLDVSYLW